MRRFLFLLLSLLVVSPFAHAARRRAVGVSGTITVGGLFSLTGDGATLGRASEAALELAVRDINVELAELDVRYRVRAVVADTQLTPAGAVAGIEALHEAGATIVIGPQSSAEAAAILEYANAHGIILISHASTAFSLAIAGDNLFRLAPNDRVEGTAVAALMRGDGIEVMVPVWREDAGQTGLKDGLVQFFTATGGVSAAGVSYAPATTDFSATVAALGAAVRAAKNAHPGKKVGVYIAAFEEGEAILDGARLDPDLLLQWYSGDGLTQSQVLLANPSVAAFAAATKLTAPAVTLSEQTRNRWEPVSEEIEARVGFLPDAYSLSVYDAAWVGVLSSLEVGNRPAYRRASFVRNVERYWGLTGPLSLDAAGDRRIADFDFWTVAETGTVVDWVRTASYVSGRLVR
ncbi:MAG TPA: ABC transporter substrate-binding protein [Thermoanaerobaculia bacterium]|nr:ABC transporter substrate-binding protein [Thermoanaerobaculia bacterium]